MREIDDQHECDKWSEYICKVAYIAGRLNLSLIFKDEFHGNPSLKLDSIKRSVSVN